LLSPPEDHLLPVTGAATALQKFERAFAQELLCPWDALDAFTDEHGLGEERIADAAAHFEVSERTILSTLVNKKKLPRDRLE
jgi:Zn-dependent peptidase ImmA (M78 family)